MSEPRSEPYRPDAPIVAEIAAGAVVERDGRILLLHEVDEDRWCLPKGHVDPGESLPVTAVREVREETGLTDVRLGDELLEVTYRFYSGAKRSNVHKTTVYFLARSAGGPVRVEEATFDRHEWVTLDRAEELLRFEADRRVVRAARERAAGRPS
ncbi:MAG TPA: NUDIX domain-containing protein [Thermoplasmata archaeon]|nr:NUDIX domain-containing protein [Thermoplasmata archaeon]